MECWNAFKGRIAAIPALNGIAIAIVYATLLVDNMLLTAVVPILPEYFFKKHLEAETSKEKVSEVSTSQATEMTFFNSSISNYDDTVIAFTTTSPLKCHMNKETYYLSHENIFIGILFASKPMVQIIANSFVGPICDFIGFSIPMFVGYVIMCASSVMFAFGSNYGMLLSARAIQGIGSACASTAGMGMLADRYSDDAERGKALGVALGGLAMGVLVGPVFGSVVYQLAGKEAVFLVLALMAVILGVAQFFIFRLNIQRRPPGDEGVPLTTLLRDPYVVLAASAILLGNICIGVLETGQPIWMMVTMCSPKWALGIAFLPESLSYLVATNLVAIFCQQLPRWLICFMALYLTSAGALCLPFATSLPELIGPGIVIGSAVGMVDASIFPLMASLVDARHKPVYGSIYAIADVAFCVAFIIGPLCTGVVVSTIGFPWLMWIIAIVTFTFAPLVLFLRKPPPRSEETIPILYRTDVENTDRIPEETEGNHE